jgi:adenosylcobinamide-phosphate synthase
MELSVIYILIGAFALDSIAGDPRWLPHLIVGYGNLISWGEKTLNFGKQRILKGGLLTLVLVSLTFSVPYLIIDLLRGNKWIYSEVFFSVVMLFYCLANRTLIKEGIAVFNVLEHKGIVEGRKRLSWIVGRDTSELNAQQIRKATLETMSENLSDGVIAPLFYFVCFGVPGIMAYKMINTLDSMIGYRSERYEKFGKIAAKLDDVANYIPARLTAVLMLVITFKLNGIVFLIREGKKHSSPNAGYPEAALAFILSCQFGGPNYYGGKLHNKPFIGHNNRQIEHKEIFRVAFINYFTSLLFILLAVLFFIYR